MSAITTRAGKDIKELAATLAAFPAPEKWTQKQRAQAVQFAALLDTAQKVISAANLASIDWEKEKAVFLENAGQEQSKHTKRGYTNALRKLEEWASPQDISLFDLTSAQADDFIYRLKASGSAPATVRVTVAAVSSLYTFLHRRHTAIDNPFRGTKARPKEKTVRPLVIPTEKEVKTILKELPPVWGIAVSIMSGLGLRCGALPSLSKRGDRYYFHSKGKDVYIDLAPNMIERIQAAGLSIREPFAGRTANSIEIMVAYYIKKLYKAGKIAAPFSCHDFRHYAAHREYAKDKDMKRVRDFLGHSSISITERYLHNIGEKV